MIKVPPVKNWILPRWIPTRVLVIQGQEPLPLKRNYCRLLCHLLVILKVIFANSVDPDQTAPLGAVWSESTLFACMQK